MNKEKPELQCNGKCHLAKQLQVSQNDSSSDESLAINTVFEAFYPLYFQVYHSENDTVIEPYLSKKRWCSNTTETRNFIYELFHPPRFVPSYFG